jgi:hypothetical protein
VFTSCLPPILASLPDWDVATATGTWTFIRNFGSIWGIAIPAAVFNTRANHLASHISDPSVRALLVNGGAYEHATKTFMNTLSSDPVVKSAVLRLYVDSLKIVLQVSIAFAGLGFLISFFVPSITLREELNTEYGLADPSSEKKTEVPQKQVTEGALMTE